jgi:hypothetical protein
LETSAATGLEKGRVRSVGLVVFAVSAAVLLLHVLFVSWRPVADWALVELHVRDVGGAHTPLVGPFSRYQWNHPGPLLFYVDALVYRPLASRASALLVTALLINGGSLAWIWIIVRRLRGLETAWAVLFLALLLTRSLGGDFLIDPWNPSVTVLPFLATIVTVWAVSLDQVRWAWVAVVLGSFVVQSHVAYLVPVATVGVAGVVLHFLHSRRSVERPPDAESTNPRSARRSIAVAAGVGGVAWLPPVIQQLTDKRGNFSAMLSFVTSPTEPRQGFAQGIRVVFDQLSMWPSWFTGNRSHNAFLGTAVVPPHPIPLALLVLVFATVVAVKRGDRTATRLCMIAIVAVFGSIIAVSGVSGPLYDYLVWWVWVIGVLTWCAILVALLGTRAQVRDVSSLWRAIGPLMCGALALVVAMQIWPAQPPGVLYSQALGEVVRPAEVAVGMHGAYVTYAGGIEAGYVAVGLTLDLERRGRVVMADPAQRIAYGAQRTAGSRRGLVWLVVASGADTIKRLAAKPGYRLLARSSRGWLSARDQLERARILRALGDASREGASTSRLASLFVRLRRLTPPISPIGVLLNQDSPSP